MQCIGVLMIRALNIFNLLHYSTRHLLILFNIFQCSPCAVQIMIKIFCHTHTYNDFSAQKKPNIPTHDTT